MNKEVKAEIPKVELASKDWTIKEMVDTERRIEKAFHAQTQFLTEKIDNSVRWMIGLNLSMTIAIILVVLFKG